MTDMIERKSDPYNAEPTPGALIERFLTPQALFYVRSHGPVPDLPANHRIEVSGRGMASRFFSVQELKSTFATRTVTAVLQCAGNRRTGELPSPSAWPPRSSIPPPRRSVFPCSSR